MLELKQSIFSTVDFTHAIANLEIVSIVGTNVASRHQEII